MALLQRGELVTVAEAALVADVGRATIYRWLRAEGVDLKHARLGCVARLRDRVQRQIDGKPSRRRPSKAEERRVAEKAVRDFNRANRR